MAGTGLPIPKSGDVLTQAPNVVDADRFTNARAWGQIAEAGSKIASTGLHALQMEEHQAQVGYLADQEIDITRKRTELRDQFAKDPAGFNAAWQGFTDGKLAEVDPRFIPHIKKSLGSEGNSAYSGLLAEKRAQDQRLDAEKLSTLATQTGNDVIGAAMAGTLSSGDGKVKADKYQAVLQSAVTAGLHTQEWADFHFDGTMSKAEGEMAARSAVSIYRDPNGGYDKAVDHLKKNILENEGLSLSLASKRSAFQHGMQALNLERTGEKADKAAIIQDIKDLKAKIDSGIDVSEAEVRDQQAAAARVGASAAHRDLTVAYEVKRQSRGLTTNELVAAASGARTAASTGLVDAVKKFEGFAPTAEWDYKQHSVGYGTRGAPGERIDRATAEVRLNEELGKAAAIVDKVNPNLPRGARDAMISLTFNSGADWVSAELGNRIRAGDLAGAKERFVQYNKAGGETNPGLVNRRAAEVQWFDRPEGAGGSSDSNPYAGQIAKGIQGVLVEQARKDLPNYKSMIERGDFLDTESMASVRYAAAVSGDAHWQREVEDLAIVNEVGLRTKDLPMSQRLAVRDQLKSELQTSGLPPVDQSFITDALDKEAVRRDRVVREDPVGHAIESGWGPPKPLDLSSADRAISGVQERVLIARGVADQEGVPPGSPFRPADRASLAGAITSGKPAQADAAFTALAGLPDEMLTAGLHTDEIKTAVTGAARSGDPARYSAAMSFMDRIWARAPETAKALFGEDSIHQLMTWQSNLRYLTPEQLAKEREKNATDPEVRKRQAVNAEEGLKLARTHKLDDVVSQFGSWGQTLTGNSPQAPVDPLTRDTLMGDFETQYSRRYAETLNKDVALKQTIELMKTKWSRSDVNGGKLMLNAPEALRNGSGNAVYPAIDGSWSWMNKQIEADIAATVGKPMNRAVTGLSAVVNPVGAGLSVVAPGTFGASNWSYSLVPDRQTSAEAQRGLPASYNVVVTDAATERTTVLPKRYAFDPTEAVARSRTDFGDQRARVLEVDNPIRANQAARAQTMRNIRESIQGPARDAIP